MGKGERRFCPSMPIREGCGLDEGREGFFLTFLSPRWGEGRRMGAWRGSGVVIFNHHADERAEISMGKGEFFFTYMPLK